jgi:hypothetical protein
MHRTSWVAAKSEASTEPSAGYGPVHVVADLVRNLLTLDQATPIYAAFHADFDGARRCRTRPVMTSLERVIDGKWVDSSRKDVPYAAIVWAKPQGDELAAGALTDDAKDAALVEDLSAALRSVNAVAIERGEKYGVCDQIDNAGNPYQSKWLADLLALRSGIRSEIAAIEAHTRAGSDHA